MSYYVTDGAAAQQIGQAAELRVTTPKGNPDRGVLNAIIHSDERTLRGGNPNPYYDPTFSYDPRAQTALNQIRSKK